MIPSLNNAPVGSNSGRKLPVGQHVVDIKRNRIHKSRKDGKLYFIVEFDVVESDNPSVAIGSEYSWSKPFVDEFGYGPAEIKEYVCFCVDALHPGTNAGVNWQDGFLAFLASEPDQANHPNPGKGLRFGMSVWEESKKTKAGTFTKQRWEPMAKGASMGLEAVAPAPAPAPAAERTSPFELPTTPAAAASSGPPPGWPANIPYPGK